MMKSLYTLLALCVMVLAGKAQSPYELRWNVDVPMLVLGGGGMIGGVLLKDQVEPFALEELAELNANNISGFDRSATKNYSTAASNTSDIFLFGSAGIPVLTMMDVHARNDAPVIGIMLIETALIVNGITDITKAGIKRSRPLAYNVNAPLEKKLETNARLSFFSGHTSNTAAYSFFTARVFCDYHPNSKLKPYVWTGAVAIPAVTGYLRYKAGKHFPSDVMAGYTAGALVGYFVPQLHKVGEENNVTILPVPQQEGMGFHLSISLR